MSCSNCNSSGFHTAVQNVNIYQPYCASEPTSCTEPGDIRAYKYLGPNLSCTNITSGLGMEIVIQRLNDAMCAVVGDFSSYDTGCISTDPITTQQQFVEAISEYVCDFKTTYNTFLTAYNTYKGTVNTRFLAIEAPGITSVVPGITPADSLNTVLIKLADKVTDIQNVKLSLSGVVWNSCFVVPTAPTSIAAAFTLLNSQICSLKTDIGDIDVDSATFNNTGSCLPGTLTSADTLSDTINKIKTRLCTLPTFDINALTWGCTTKPSSTTTDLQAAFQSVLSQLTFLKQNLPTFDVGDFTVTNVNNSDLCAGKTVSIAGGGGGGGTDRYVAIDVSDTTPGTLASKLVEGTNIQLDITTVPGQMIIRSTAVGPDEKVKSRSADTTGGFLEDKIEGSADVDSGITITKTTNTGANKVTIGADVNPVTLMTYLLDSMATNPTLAAKFCELVTDCLPDCIIPPNVTVLYDTSSNIPSPPTSGVVDDTANSFNWTNSSSFTSVSDYEQTLDGGLNYTALSAKPIVGLTGNRAIGSVGVRVKAIGSNPPSTTLFNSTAYTA